MKTLSFTCDNCDTVLEITLKNNLTVNGEVLRCPVCDSRKFSFFDDVRLHSAGFKIRILHKCDSHFLVEALENHGEIKKGDTFLMLREHVKEPPR